MTLLPIAPALFATPAYVGVLVSLCLKLAAGVAVGQAYALLVVAVAADAWAGIVAMLGALAFVSSHLLLRDFQWGIAMCLAGTVFCFITVKAQYVGHSSSPAARPQPENLRTSATEEREKKGIDD